MATDESPHRGNNNNLPPPWKKNGVTDVGPTAPTTVNGSNYPSVSSISSSGAIDATPNSKARMQLQMNGGTVQAIEKISREREARRRSAQHAKSERSKQEAQYDQLNNNNNYPNTNMGSNHNSSSTAPSTAANHGSGASTGNNIPMGPKLDRSVIEFMRMITAYRDEHHQEGNPHAPPGHHSICVVVRKRPLSKREALNGEYDAVTCLNPRVIVHAPKTKVDGITKYLENTTFNFDHTFHEHSTNEDVYIRTVMPLVGYAFQHKGRGTCFAYGQTGSGKTFTMSSIQRLVARDIFRGLSSKEMRNKNLTVHAAFFEIYGGRTYDVLHDRATLVIRENEKGRVVIVGLQEVICPDEETLMDVINQGNASRTTHSTEVNEQSSRSHAICEITLRTPDNKVHGSLSLIDLAGSERAADSRNHSQQRRIESAEINKSLLALKECIRQLALRAAANNNPDNNDNDNEIFIPYRASKLTLALRDSFEAPNARVVMIATVSPNASSADHTGNTLRYADRVKEKPNDMDSLGDNHRKGKNGKNIDGSRAQEVTFSFLESVASSGTNPVSSSGNLPPRVSPLTIESNPQQQNSSGIVEARAPPKPIFQRMKNVPSSTTGTSSSASSSNVNSNNNKNNNYSGDNYSNENSNDPNNHKAMIPPRAAKHQPPQRVRVSRYGNVDADNNYDDSGKISDNDSYTKHGNNHNAHYYDDDDNASNMKDNESDSLDGMKRLSVKTPQQQRKSNYESKLTDTDDDNERMHKVQSTSSSVNRPARRVLVNSSNNNGSMNNKSAPESVANEFKSPSAVRVPVVASQQGGTGNNKPPMRPKATEDTTSVEQEEQLRKPNTKTVAPARTIAEDLRAIPEVAAATAQQEKKGFRKLLKAAGLGRSAVPSSSASNPPPPSNENQTIGTNGIDPKEKLRNRGRKNASTIASTGSSVRSDSEDDRQSIDDVPSSNNIPPPTRSSQNNASKMNNISPRRNIASVDDNKPIRKGTGTKGPSPIPSPQRDLQFLHDTLRRDLKSSNGQHQSQQQQQSNSSANIHPHDNRNDHSSSHHNNNHHQSPYPNTQEEEDEESMTNLLALHEMVGRIVDEEQDLLEAHVLEIQENAELLQHEGTLLASVQGRESVDYDIGSYAKQLRNILEKKLHRTHALLEKVKTFQSHLALEEEVSKKVDASTLRQSIIL